MGIFDAMCRGAAISNALGFDDGHRAGMQAMFIEEDRRAEKENLKNQLDQMYALAQYLHDHGAPINKKGLDILRRYGYDVSEFLD